jgi:hypothetical protein
MSENLVIAIFLQAWLQSSPWPSRLDIRHRILAQFEAINQVADALHRAAYGHGIPEDVVGGESALLTRPGDPEALATALREAHAGLGVTPGG